MLNMQYWENHRKWEEGTAEIKREETAENEEQLLKTYNGSTTFPVWDGHLCEGRQWADGKHDIGPNSTVPGCIPILSTPGARTLVPTSNSPSPTTKLIPNPTATEILCDIRGEKQRRLADTRRSCLVHDSGEWASSLMKGTYDCNSNIRKATARKSLRPTTGYAQDGLEQSS